MTAICGGGTSSAKPGFGAFTYMGPAAIGALMNNWPTPWAVVAAGYLGLLTYDMATFCSTDPPATPTLTAADYFNLVSFLDPVAHQLAIAKFTNWIGSRLWFDLCKCDSVTTPAPPTAPSIPTGWPTVNPGIPSPGAPCASTGVLTDTIFGVGSGVPVTSGITYSILNATNLTLTGAGQTIFASLTNYYDDPLTLGPGLALGQDNVTIAPNSSATLLLPAPVGTNYVREEFAYLSGSGTTRITWKLDAYCTSAPPGGDRVDCCPPDPSLVAQVQQILSLVTLIQRQSAPFGYVYGSNHTALSGNGQFSVADLIGVSVDVTTLPGSYGRQAGTPEELFDLGFVNLGTADGWLTSRRIDHDGSLFIPPLGGLFTTVGYSLSPGVVVSIRELVREP